MRAVYLLGLNTAYNRGGFCVWKITYIIYAQTHYDTDSFGEIFFLPFFQETGCERKQIMPAAFILGCIYAISSI